MRREGREHSWDPARFGCGVGCGGESPGPGSSDEDGQVKTRTLILLAVVTGVAIVVAGTIQILMAS